MCWPCLQGGGALYSCDLVSGRQAEPLLGIIMIQAWAYFWLVVGSQQLLSSPSRGHLSIEWEALNRYLWLLESKELFPSLFIFFLKFLKLHLGVCVCVYVHLPWSVCAGQRIACRSHFSPSATCALGIRLRGKYLYLLKHLTDPFSFFFNIWQRFLLCSPGWSWICNLSALASLIL